MQNRKVGYYELIWYNMHDIKIVTASYNAL
jgi:hypothetical protein